MCYNRPSCDEHMPHPLRYWATCYRPTRRPKRCPYSYTQTLVRVPDRLPFGAAPRQAVLFGVILAPLWAFEEISHMGDSRKRHCLHLHCSGDVRLCKMKPLIRRSIAEADREKAFECGSNVSQAWDPTFPTGCVSLPATYFSTAAINIATDLVILVMPIPPLLGLHMNARKRCRSVSCLIEISTDFSPQTLSLRSFLLAALLL